MTIRLMANRATDRRTGYHQGALHNLMYCTIGLIPLTLVR